MPTSTTPASAARLSPGFWRQRAIGWQCLPSRIGTTTQPLPKWESPGLACSSEGETWTVWWPTTPWRSGGGTRISTPRGVRWGIAPTGLPLCMPTGPGRPSEAAHPLSSAGWRRRCGALPTTTIGTIRCAGPFSLMHRRTCWCTAWGRRPREKSPGGFPERRR